MPGLSIERVAPLAMHLQAPIVKCPSTTHSCTFFAMQASEEYQPLAPL